MVNIFVILFAIIAIGSIIWMFVFLTFSIIRAFKERNNVLLSLFFAFMILTLFINIYAFTLDLDAQKNLYLMLMRSSGAAFLIGITFTVVYLSRIKIIFNKEAKIQHSAAFIVIMIVLVLIYIFLGQGEIGPNLEPTYSPETNIYIFSLFILVLIAFIHQAFALRKLSIGKELQKKIDSIIVGIGLINVIFLTVLLANAQIVPLPVLMVVFSSGSILSSILLYQGFSF